MALMEASLLILLCAFHSNAAVTFTQQETPSSPENLSKPPAPSKPTPVTPTGKPPVLPPVTEIRSCPKDFPRVDCPVNPCVLLRCPLKGAECVVDSCGKCRPRWINAGKEITMDCLESLKLCSDGSVPEKCEVNPCETARCPDVEGAVCVADFCGGCRDRWIHDGMEVTKKCRVPVPVPAYESANPNGFCKKLVCHIFRDAMCLEDIKTYSHRWLRPNGVDVTFVCDNEPRLDELVFQSQYPGPGSCVGAKCRHPGLYREAECRPCQPPRPHCVNDRSWTDRYGQDVTWLCEYGF